MNELSKVLDEMIACGNGLVKAAQEMKLILAEAPVTEAPAAEVVTYSFTDVRKAFAAKSHAGFTDQVKALIEKYGAKRLSDVKEEDYPALMEDLEAIA